MKYIDVSRIESGKKASALAQESIWETLLGCIFFVVLCAFILLVL